MKKKFLVSGLIFAMVLVIVLLLLPKIVIYGDNKVTFISYSDDISKFESSSCYDESYYYYKDLDISINSFKIEKRLFLYFITLEYEKGNVCDKEFVLEKAYIDKFLQDAVIESNENNIDIGALLDGREAIVGNVRYSEDELIGSIYYVLDGEESVIRVFYSGELLIIQVGASDEGPKYIAYK